MRIVTFVVALVILMGVAVVDAPSASAEDGMVRIHLTRLGSISTLTLTTTCTYYVNGDKNQKIPSGAKVEVSLSEGALSYAVNEDAKRPAGNRLTLNRGKRGASGMKFVKPKLANLFCGDLMLSISSGKIKPVLRIYVEDYLYGVVAYEMSNSFPLEALKAQAVAARNYAMANRKSGGTHDMTDDTNSQVFKGYNADHKNVIKAVNETKGVCAMYGGKLVNCYYGSSNGGQVDTAKNIWGGAVGYTEMKDDPYDLDNPQSAIKTLAVAKKPTSTNPLNKKLRSDLVSAMKGKLKKKGLKTGEGDVSIERINSITPHSPRFPEPSRTYTKLRFSIDVKGIQEDSGEWVGLEDPIQVDLSTYDALKSKFSLGHQNANVEIISIDDSGDAFSIEFRRWGHGVGMSQRGAQWMAKKHSMSYKQILKFYYSGIKLTDMDLSDATMNP